MSRNLVCFKCGKTIEEGGIFYIVEMKITSGFDGVIKEKIDSGSIMQLIDKIEAQGAMAAEEDVFKELKINLCKHCRDILIDFIGGPSFSPEKSNKLNH